MWKILCWFKLHRYEDKIKLKKFTQGGIPFEATEVCKGCGKVRGHVTGHITDPAALMGIMKGVQNGDN